MKQLKSTIIDEYFAIKSGNDSFFDFIGSNNYQLFTKLIYSDDLCLFQNALKDANGLDGVEIIIRLLRQDNIYRYVVMKIFSKEYSKNEKMFEISFLDVLDLKGSNLNYLQELKIQKTYLSMENAVYFKYGLETQNLMVYILNNKSEVCIYNGSFDEWERNIIDNKYILKESLISFNKLCHDIKNAKGNFSYNLINNIFSQGKEKVLMNFKGRTIELTEDEKIVLIMASSVNFNENEKNHYLTLEASKDILTGLLNKKIIKHIAEEKLSLKAETDLAFVILDIDHFKMINDTFGHMFGDEVIFKVSQIITSNVGDRGIVGRIGGDEFFIILEGLNDITDLRSILRSIRTSIEVTYKNKLEGKISLTCSMGVSRYPYDGDTYDDLFKTADMALYIAKEKGRNRYIIYNYMLHGSLQVNENNKAMINFRSVKKIVDKTTFLCNLLDYINCKGRDMSLVEIFEDISVRYCLDRIRLFLGKDLKLKYCWGCEFDENDDAQYIYEDNYLEYFNENNMFVIHHMDDIELRFKNAFLKFKEQEQVSVVQCLLCCKDEIAGLFSFELIDRHRVWEEEELSIFPVVSKIIFNAIKD